MAPVPASALAWDSSLRTHMDNSKSSQENSHADSEAIKFNEPAMRSFGEHRLHTKK